MTKQKTIHIIQHAQSFCQLPLDDPNTSLHDPDLTSTGIAACQSFSIEFPCHASVRLLVASPLRRDLHTALVAFEPVVQRGLKIVALPAAQEPPRTPSDAESSVEVLRRELGDYVDYSHMNKGRQAESCPSAFGIRTLPDRALAVREWLSEREEDVIALVTHGSFAYYLTEDVDASGNCLGPCWLNLRWRSFYLHRNATGRLRLEETSESERRNVSFADDEDEPMNFPHHTSSIQSPFASSHRRLDF